jgi:hypothetical protein
MEAWGSPMKWTMFLFLLFFHGLAVGEGGQKIEKTPRIRQGFEIKVVRYDRATDLIEVEIVKEPGVGPNFTTADSLFLAIGSSGSASDFKKQISTLKGKTYALKKNLPLVTDEDVEKRLKKAADAGKTGEKK